MTADQETLYRVLVRRALSHSDGSNLQLHFALSVLDRYRRAGGFSLIRTNSVGRLRRQGAWSLDFGIAPDEASIHASFGDLQRLPQEDREHFAAHALTAPASAMFLQMRISPGSCYDDGEVRTWQ